MGKPQVMGGEMKKSVVLEVLHNGVTSISIGPFSERLQPLINETLVEAKKDKYRKGTILTPILVVWVVLSIAIRRELEYGKVLNWLVSGVRWMGTELPAKLVACGTISHARVKLGFEVFRSLFSKSVASLGPHKPDFHGFVSVVFDGTCLTMPDTEDNQAEFSKPKTGRGKAGFPQTRVMALMVRAARYIIDIAYASYQGKGTGERALMMQILQRTKDLNFLYMFDAGFYSFALVFALQQQGQNFLMKISSSIRLLPVKGGILGDGSYLALVKGKIEDLQSSRSKRRRFKELQILVRVIQFQIPGFRPVRLITSILDINITAKELACHYHKRWDIEIGYDEIKIHQCSTLRGQSPTHLRSKRADLVKQEIYAIMIVYNHIRLIMSQAAEMHGEIPLEISFVDSYQLVLEAIPEMNRISEDMKKQTHSYLLRLISESTIDRPRRPRINPRVIKIKMSKFSLKRPKHKSQERHLEKDIMIIPLPNQQAEMKEAA